VSRGRWVGAVAAVLLLLVAGIAVAVYGPANLVGAVLLVVGDSDGPAREEATRKASEDARATRLELATLADPAPGDVSDAVANTGGHLLGEVVAAGAGYRADVAFRSTGAAGFAGDADVLLCVRFERSAAGAPVTVDDLACPADVERRVPGLGATGFTTVRLVDLDG